MFEGADLVVHERDQRAYDYGQTVVGEGGQLIAQRLTLASGHQYEGRTAAAEVADDLLLAATERRKAESVGELSAVVDGSHWWRS